MTKNSTTDRKANTITIHKQYKHLEVLIQQQTRWNSLYHIS